MRADSIKNETNNFDGKNKREKELGEQSRDDITEEQTDDDGSEDDDDDDGEESDNEEDDDLEATKHLSTKCYGKIESFCVKCSVTLKVTSVQFRSIVQPSRVTFRSIHFEIDTILIFTE